MTQKNSFSPISHLFQGKNERASAYKSLATPAEDVAAAENKENLWKRKVDVQATPLSVGNDCGWKRQRCSYKAEPLNGPAAVESMGGTMLDNKNMNGYCTNDVHNKKRKEPSDGITFMMALDVPSPSSDSSSAMVLDDALDFLNPEDYYEDKWH